MYKRKFSGEIHLSGAQIGWHCMIDIRFRNTNYCTTVVYPNSNETFKQFDDHAYLFGIKPAGSDRVYVLDAEVFLLDQFIASSVLFSDSQSTS